MYNTTDYEDIICRDIDKYYCEHGKLPKAIFVSTSLCEIMMISYNFKLYNTSGGVVYMFHGIELKPYSSDKMEYYLVSNGCVLG